MIEYIKNFLPHRYPFLLIDKIIKIKKYSNIKTIKTITISDPFFFGHFPQKPVVPGVLILESMAQTAGILIYYSKKINPKKKIIYLASINNTKFRKIVIPGDVVYFIIEVKNIKMNMWKFYCEAIVKKKLICNSYITCIAK